MATAPLTYTDRERTLNAIKDRWRWLLVLGIASLALGTVGLLTAVLFTIASVLAFGVLLVVAAGFQAFQAYRAAGWHGRVPHVLIAIVYAVAGAVMLADPLGASVALTLLLGIALILVGFLRLFMTYQMRGSPGWGWSLTAGIASILLGIVILVGWPQSALWVIGLIVAIELIVNGWVCVLLALAARRFDSKSVT